MSSYSKEPKLYKMTEEEYETKKILMKNMPMIYRHVTRNDKKMRVFKEMNGTVFSKVDMAKSFCIDVPKEVDRLRRELKYTRIVAVVIFLLLFVRMIIG